MPSFSWVDVGRTADRRTISSEKNIITLRKETALTMATTRNFPPSLLEQTTRRFRKPVSRTRLKSWMSPFHDLILIFNKLLAPAYFALRFSRNRTFLAFIQAHETERGSCFGFATWARDTETLPFRPVDFVEMHLPIARIQRTAQNSCCT